MAASSGQPNLLFLCSADLQRLHQKPHQQPRREDGTWVEICNLVFHLQAFLKGRVITSARLNAFRPLYTMARAAGLKIAFNPAPMAAARKAAPKPTAKRPTPKK